MNDERATVPAGGTPSLRVYAFISTVEPIWGAHSEVDIGAENPLPTLLWIESDCILADHFEDCIGEKVVPLLDPLLASNDEIARRKDLLDLLLRDPAKLKTVYLVAGRDRSEYHDWRQRFRPSTWHHLEVSVGETEIDISDPEHFPVEPHTETVVVAANAYTDKGLDHCRFTVLPMGATSSRNLPEVFSLNHVRDLPYRDEGGDGGEKIPEELGWGPDGLPLVHHDSLEKLLDLHHPSSLARSVLRGHERKPEDLRLIYETRRRRWRLEIGEQVYFADSETGWWSSPGKPELRQLIVAGPRWYFLTSWELEKAKALAVSKLQEERNVRRAQTIVQHRKLFR